MKINRQFWIKAAEREIADGNAELLWAEFSVFGIALPALRAARRHRRLAGRYLAKARKAVA